MAWPRLSGMSSSFSTSKRRSVPIRQITVPAPFTTRTRPWILKHWSTTFGLPLHNRPCWALRDIGMRTARSARRSRFIRVSRPLNDPTKRLLTSKTELRPGWVVFVVELAEFCGRSHGNADCVSWQGVESFDAEDLAGKYFAEVAGNGFGYGVQVQRLAEFLLHRSHGLCGDAAGDDQVELGQEDTQV